MHRPLAVAAVLILQLPAIGCATPTGYWTTYGAVSSEQSVQALELVEAARRVTPDAKGWLARGGQIHFALGPYALDGACPVPAGLHVSGCSSPGLIEVLIWPERGFGPDLLSTSLPHELCHLGLERGGGCPEPFCEALRLPSEDESDACALLVVQEWRKAQP